MSLSKRIFYIAVLVSLLTLVHVFVFGVWARVYGLLDSSLILFSAGVALVLVFLNVLPKIRDNFVSSLLYAFSLTWLGAIFLVFCTTLVYQVAYYVAGADNLPLYLALQTVAIVAAFYAIFNADRIEVVSLKIPFSGIDRPVRLVHLSDIHIGTVHRKGFLQQVVDMTNAQNPDLVLITGDLFDGSAPVYPDMLIPLDDLVAPAYFSHGNHEEYEGLLLVKDTIKGLRLELLDNKKVTWNGVEIIGVNDAKSLRTGETLDSVLESLSLDVSQPKILMYHTPVDWAVARKHGIALMLSGHTHNGQVFPFTLLVRVAFRYIKGLYTEEGKFLHVTPGTGTWGPPMRLGSRNQITTIDLQPIDT
jgi:predicted MPP superfamily phosphohydrolase